MPSLVAVSRVTVIAESEMEKSLVEQFVRMGAKGYTTMPCRGRGEHEIYEDPFLGTGRVRIETIVQPKVADDIMRYLQSPAFAARPLTACVEAVQVLANDRF